MKKIVLLFLIFVLFASSLVSCTTNENLKPGNDNDNEDNYESNGENNSQTTTEDTQVYRDYPNLVRIDQFHNGLAAFMIYNATSTTHWTSQSSWTGDYFFGYINIKGEVVIPPKYECSPDFKLPKFESEYVTIKNLDEKDYLIDKTGAVVFESQKNNVTGIGNICEGYLWVESVEEDISGSMYTVRYYSATDLKIIASFNNARAFYDNYYTAGRSSVSTSGDVALISGQDHHYYDDELIEFNITEYDDFNSTQNTWTVDLNEVENFASASKCYYHISGTNNKNGMLATVALKNSNGTWFYAVVDSSGEVLMQPQKNIAFPISKDVNDIDNFDFCNNLCPAEDTDTGLWGYIDPNGNWKIQPEYFITSAFSEDGYATVNNRLVINTEGEVILSPKGWTNEIITKLSGTYKYTGDGYSTWYLTFEENGELRITEDMDIVGATWSYGEYKIKGGSLIISDIGYSGCPGIMKDGTYPFRKEGDSIFIDTYEWKKSNVRLPEE